MGNGRYEEYPNPICIDQSSDEEPELRIISPQKRQSTLVPGDKQGPPFSCAYLSGFKEMFPLDEVFGTFIDHCEGAGVLKVEHKFEGGLMSKKS